MTRWSSLLVSLCLGLIALVGCQRPDTHVESVLNTFVKPAMDKALTEGATRTASLQGGLQGINPKYVVEFQGKWVVGVEGRATCGLEGVSGQITGHLQTDNEATPRPGG